MISKKQAIALGWPAGPGQPLPLPPTPGNMLTFANGAPLQFSDGKYLELSS